MAAATAAAFDISVDSPQRVEGGMRTSLHCGLGKSSALTKTEVAGG